MFVDSHAHLTSEEVWPHLPGMMQRAEKNLIETILNIATDPKSLGRALSLQETYPQILHAAAIPPHDVEQYGETEFEMIKEAAVNQKLVAIGETGLDYFHHSGTKEQQKKWLIRYLSLAKETALPVVIHCRDAFNDLFEILDLHYSGKVVLHCFTGNANEALEVIQRGWFLSLSGILTFKKSQELREIVSKTPLEQMLIETDAPFLAPMPYRGKLNEPAYLVHTAETMAQIKGISKEEIGIQTKANFYRFLGR